MSVLGRLRSAIGRRPADQPAVASPRPIPGPDPLALEYQSLQNDLTAVRRSIADAALARRKLEAQANEAWRGWEAANERAQIAVAKGQEDLARAALTEVVERERRLTDRHKAIDSLRSREDELHSSAARLEAKIEDYRSRLDAARGRLAQR